MVVDIFSLFYVIRDGSETDIKIFDQVIFNYREVLERCKRIGEGRGKSHVVKPFIDQGTSFISIKSHRSHLHVYTYQ